MQKEDLSILFVFFWNTHVYFAYWITHQTWKQRGKDNLFDFVWNSFCISNHHHHHHHYQTRKLRGRDDLSILIVRDTFSSNKETKRKIWFVDFVCLKYFLIFHHQTGKKGVKMILSNLFVWNTFWYFIIKLGDDFVLFVCLKNFLLSHHQTRGQRG